MPSPSHLVPVCHLHISIDYTSHCASWLQLCSNLGNYRHFNCEVMLISLVLFLGTSLPQKVLGTSEEISGKKHAEDTISVASSLHSSPPASPQGSPRKGKTEQFKLVLVLPNNFVTYILRFNL